MAKKSIELPAPEIIAEPVVPDAAIAFWKQRAKLTDEEAKALGEEVKHRAFYVTGLAKQDLVQLVSDGIEEALKNGETLADFKKRIAAAIQAQGWHDYRVENIFRTNMQVAYSAGRYKKMQAVKASRPYWQYIAVMDKRVRPSHAILHEKVYPADHEFWSSNYPPNGFRCRCGVRTLSARQVKKQGLTVETEMPKADMWTDPKTGYEYFVHFPGADKGFKNNPGKDWVQAGLNLKKYPDMTPQSYAQQRGNGVIRPVTNEAELARQIAEHAAPHLKNGPVVFDNGGYFMATNSRGALWISKRKFGMPGGVFCPAADLKAAWNKIAVNKPLSFHEEYAVESLWHEIVHNRQTLTSAGGSNTLARRMMETVTQWVARRSYPRFLEALGGKAAHQAKVLRQGYGYSGYIRNFDKLLQALGIDDGPEALTYFEGVCATANRKQYGKAIADYLAKHAAKPASRAAIRDLLSKTDRGEREYDALLRAHQLTA